MKYSTVKACIFDAAKTVEGLKNVELLDAAATRWLSHGGGSEKRLVSQL